MIRSFAGCFIVMMFTTTNIVIEATYPCNLLDVTVHMYDCYNIYSRSTSLFSNNITGPVLSSIYTKYCGFDSYYMRHCFYEEIENCTEVQEIKEANTQSQRQFCEAVNRWVLPYLQRPEQRGVLVPGECARNLENIQCFNMIRQQVPELRPLYSDNFTVGMQKRSTSASLFLNCSLTSDFDLNNLDGCEGVEPTNAILFIILQAIDAFALGLDVDEQLMEQIVGLTIPESGDPLGIFRRFNMF